MKKFRLIMLLLLCAVIILSACSEKAGETRETDSGTESEETVPELPAVPVKNFGGKEFVIFTSNWWDYAPFMVLDICPEEYNGEPLNDAAYERKTKIEETYNCKISQIQGVYDTAPDTVRLQTAVRAGDQLCDFAMMRGLYFTGLLTDNFLIDLDQLENIDFENPWWRKECSDALRLGGKRFGVSGNISTAEITLTAMICFNKAVVEDFGLESPYELVKSGNWTLDKMVEMSKAVAHDIDGDGVMTTADMWGINYNRDTVWNLLNSCGVKCMELDDEGYPEIVIDKPEYLSKTQNILEKMFDESYSSNNRRIAAQFGAQRALFVFSWANGVISSRVYEFDFGIVPLPKYDTAQNDYMPNVYGLGLPITCVPSTNDNLEDTGLFMEVLSYEGYKNLVPVYYENVLKTKSARDSESEDMIDYIFGNLHYDTGTLLDFEFFTQRICEMAETLNTNIASHLAQYKPAAETVIKKVMDTIMSEVK